MRKAAILSVAALAILGSAIAEAAPGDRLRPRLQQREGAVAAPVLPGAQTIAYGSDPFQVLDFWRAKGAAGPAPLVSSEVETPAPGVSTSLDTNGPF